MNKTVIATVLGLAVVASVMITGAVAQTGIMAPKPIKFVDSGNPVIPVLTDEEKSRTMNIINTDAQTSAIIGHGNWTILQMGPMTNGSTKYGSMVLIKFAQPEWIEGTFRSPFSGESSNAKLWVSAMHIAVDLKTNKIMGIEPEMTRPPTGAPIVDKKIDEAERVAINQPIVKALGENPKANLAAVYVKPDYPSGIAFFSISTTSGEDLVAVDLSNMIVVEKYTGKVGNR